MTLTSSCNLPTGTPACSVLAAASVCPDDSKYSDRCNQRQRRPDHEDGAKRSHDVPASGFMRERCAQPPHADAEEDGEQAHDPPEVLVAQRVCGCSGGLHRSVPPRRGYARPQADPTTL